MKTPSSKYPPAPAEPPAAPIRVAIVEDDAGLRRTLTTFINRAGGMKCVAGCASAEAALKELPSGRPDVVLMDIRLPGMSGIECVKALQDILPDARSLMLTAYEEDEDVLQSLLAGAFGYLLKNAEPERLTEAIREVHMGGSPFSGSVARKIVGLLREGQGKQSAETQTELTPREVEILRRLAGGCAYKVIADELGASINTVRTHVKRIYEKLHAHNRTEAVSEFRKRGGR